MNAQASALNDPMTPAHNSTSVQAASELQQLVWSVRREIWENRSLYLAPAAAAALILFGFLVGVLRVAHQREALASINTTQQWNALDGPLNLSAGVFMAVGMIVALFYCLDAFLAAAAVITTQDREVNQRTKIAWRDLPDKQGEDVAMSPIHGQVYQALVANTKMQDMDADFVESDATNSQVALTSMWSVSQTEQALKDLERVGFIYRTRRHNQSSLTKIFRTPGHFGGQRSATTATNSLEIDVPSLAKRIVDALGKHQLKQHIKLGEYDSAFSHPSKMSSLDFEERIKEALQPRFFGSADEIEVCCGLGVPLEYRDAVAKCINSVLPACLRAVSYFPATVCLSLPAEEVARKVLRLIMGSEMPFERFDADIRDVPVLGRLLIGELRMGCDSWRKVQASKDPIATLNEIARHAVHMHAEVWQDILEEDIPDARDDDDEGE